MSARTYIPLVVLAVLVLYASPAAAFGAGNIASISKIEGTPSSYAPDEKGSLADELTYRPELAPWRYRGYHAPVDDGGSSRRRKVKEV